MDKICWVRCPGSYIDEEHRWELKPWVLEKNHSSIESQYLRVSFVSIPLYHTAKQQSSGLDMNFSMMENAAPSRQIWAILVVTAVLYIKFSICLLLMSPCSAFWSSTPHSTPHLFSIWHIPQIHKDGLVLSKLLFSSFTPLNHFSLCLWPTGPPTFLIGKSKQWHQCTCYRFWGWGRASERACQMGLSVVKAHVTSATLQSSYSMQGFSTTHCSPIGPDNPFLLGAFLRINNVEQHPWPLHTRCQ